jgi:RNA polymerase sigma factor (sigma-70 family)
LLVARRIGLHDADPEPTQDPGASRSVPCRASRCAPSDAELLDGCRAGDEDAWHRLVDRYARLVYSVPRRLGLAQDVVDDTFQETWAALFRRLHAIRHPEAIPQWLITTAKRVAVRNARRRKAAESFGSVERHRVQIERLEATGEEAHADEHADRVERELHVAHAFERLDPTCRELLAALVRNDAPTYAQIADRLGVPIGSIGPRRARCLHRLLELLPPEVRRAFSPAED